MCPSTGHLLGVHCSQQPYPFHPTPPYYNHSEPVATSSYSQQQQQPPPQQQQQQQQYLATPSSHLLQPQQQPHQDQHFQSQPNIQRRQQQQQHPQQHLAVNTKMGLSTTSTTPSTASPLSTRKHQQQQSISQLADFAAHMVCYLLYGHQPAKPTHHHHHHHHHNATGTPPSSIPSSPLPGQGSHNPVSCLCEVCSSHSSEAHSPLRSTGSSGHSQFSSSWPHYLPPPLPAPSSSSSLSSPLDRPTHRRILSESDIVQPKPMFRKFCLDVLSATLLSPSVILLSLKYIQQLMINLKESNKIVNTGEGAEYRFFTGALILANKFLDDNTFTNKTWADITGMKIKDVNHLEMQFLSGIEFRLFTSSWQYSEWLAKLTQFTGTYMPSQHEVAYQQQTAAAQSPISPMDPNTTVAAAAADEMSGSGPVRDHGHSAVGGSNSSIHPYAVVLTSSLSMTSISHYIDSVKHIHHKSSSTNSRFQRLAAPTSYHHSSQLASNPTTVPSHQHQHQHQQQYQSQQQQQQPQYSSLPPSGSFTSSPSSLPYAYQPRPAEPIHRKRSANIAFEDIMDRSPRYEPGLLPQTTSQQQLSGGSVSRHKRFSSSSSVATLMGSLSTGTDTFHNGHSPMTQQPERYQQQQRPLSGLPQRASSGALSHSFRASGGHHLHQRSASGGNFYVDMTSAGSSPYGHESSSSHTVLSMPPNPRDPRRNGVHPLDEDHHHHHGYYAPSKGSYMPPQHTQQPPQQQQRHSNHRHSHSHSLHSTVSPSYSPNGYESPCHSMGYSGNTNRNTQGGPTTYEIDPRLWGPLDSLSLYAITTQAAKRVVAQGKALSSSANGLHMYYPTTLA